MPPRRPARALAPTLVDVANLRNEERYAEAERKAEEIVAATKRVDDLMLAIMLGVFDKSGGSHGARFYDLAKAMVLGRKLKDVGLAWQMLERMVERGELDDAERGLVEYREAASWESPSVRPKVRDIYNTLRDRRGQPPIAIPAAPLPKPPAREASLRGDALLRVMIAKARAVGRKRPAPVPQKRLDRLTFDDGSKLPPSLAAWLAYDGGWFKEVAGWPPARGPVKTMTIAALAARRWGRGAYRTVLHDLAATLLPGKVVRLNEGSESFRFLYLGAADDAGEYPVMFADCDDGLVVGIDVPGLDVWLGERAGLFHLKEARRAHATALAEASTRAFGHVGHLNNDGTGPWYRMSLAGESMGLARPSGP